ncbi:MAG: FUSC family protein, partial [Trebonia sp.]
TPGYLLSPKSPQRKAVAEVYHALARDLRQIGTPVAAGAHVALAGALNTAYDLVLTTRASASGRSRRDTHLIAVLNVSHQFAEADAALRATGERVPPLVTEEIDRFGDAVVADHGPGSGAIGFGGRPPKGGPPLPLIPPQWSPSPGAVALRDAMVNLVRVLSGNWRPAAAVPGGAADHGLRERLRARARRVLEQLIGGRIAWEFTIRLMLCTGVGAVASEVLPLARSYWLVLTVGTILKPDFGSVFARAVQRGVGTIVGAVLAAVILALVPYGPWLLLPFGVLAALLPFAKARNYGLVATFLTPLVVLLVDLLDVGGWHLAEARLVDTALASVIVLVVGYAPWPSAWQAHLPGQFAETLRTVCAYTDEALVTMPAARIAATGSATSPRRAPGEAPGLRPRLRRGAYQSLSNLRAEFQRMMSEPPAVSRRATAWWPAVVGLDEVMDAVTATVVSIGRGAPVPSAGSVHALTGTLRAVADAVETETPPRVVNPLPADPDLEAVTASVRSVISVLIKGEDDLPVAGAAR